jgi:hypothetical protein
MRLGCVAAESTLMLQNISIGGVGMNQIAKCVCPAVVLLALMTPNHADAQVRRNISIDSNCAKPLRIYISHADGYRNWHVHGPFEFSAYEGPTRLRVDDVVLTQTENHDLYIYAEALDGSSIWSGNQNFEYRGMTYSMTKAALTVVNGEARVNLTCS